MNILAYCSLEFRIFLFNYHMHFNTKTLKCLMFSKYFKRRDSRLFREVNTIAAHVIYIQIFTQSP